MKPTLYMLFMTSENKADLF